LFTGCAFAPMTGAVLAANVIAGRLARRIGARRVIAAGAASMAAGSAALLVVRASSGYAQVVTQTVVVGVGIGLVVPDDDLGHLSSKRNRCDAAQVAPDVGKHATVCPLAVRRMQPSGSGDPTPEADLGWGAWRLRGRVCPRGPVGGTG